MSESESDGGRAQVSKQQKPSDRSVQEYLEYTALTVLVVFGVLSAFQFYDRTSAAISEFVSAAYQPVFLALFNLAVLLVCTAGIVVLLRGRVAE